MRRHRQNCKKASPWRPEDWLNPSEAPSPARGPPGNRPVSALTLGRADGGRKKVDKSQEEMVVEGRVADLEKKGAGEAESEIYQGVISSWVRCSELRKV